MLDAIIDNLKSEVGSTLMEKVGLNAADVDKTLSITGETVQKTIGDESSGNGLEGILSLFSNSSNNAGADNLLSSLGSNLLSGLTSGGFDSNKAGMIKEIIMPVIVNLISNKVGGDAGALSGLLGGKKGIAGAATGMLKGLFK